ncbi:hypothetical protein ATANTOWER_003119 [Ataeniobius toweri]|uniref:Secreted protein n=1 Tax=Ataeniobius toweri TaxID=208326 RepID=A0ABU7ASI0_9TELE|nr:hypothetical protein [Ataeniobius toweri]
MFRIVVLLEGEVLPLSHIFYCLLQVLFWDCPVFLPINSEQLPCTCWRKASPGMMLPPLCFTVVRVCSWGKCSVGFPAKKSFACRPKSSISASSGEGPFFHMNAVSP